MTACSIPSKIWDYKIERNTYHCGAYILVRGDREIRTNNIFDSDKCLGDKYSRVRIVTRVILERPPGIKDCMKRECEPCRHLGCEKLVSAKALGSWTYFENWANRIAGGRCEERKRPRMASGVCPSSWRGNGGRL